MKLPLFLTLALRELRGGLRHFRLFLACLIIGTAVIAAVASLSANIRQTIFDEAKTLLGGDISLSATNHQATPDELNFIQQWGRVSEVVEMRAMASFGTSVALVELKGVGEGYPLLGSLDRTDGLPAKLEEHTVLVAPDLLDRLNTKVGDTIMIGSTNFLISGVIKNEPDRATGAFGLGPRIIARTEDMQKAGFLGPEELVHYHERILLTEPQALLDFQKAWSKRFPKSTFTTHNFHDANQSTSRFVSRLQLFLTLAGLATLLIGGIGILNATQAYLLRKIPTIAILKSTGASQRLVFSIYAALLTLIALLGALTGAIIGAISAWLIVPYLAQFFPIRTTVAFYPLALIEAIWFGLLTVAVFAIAVLGRCISVRPALLFRSPSTIAGSKMARGWIFINLFLIILLAGSLVLTAADKKIAIGFVFAAIFSIGILTAIARLLQWGARRYRFNRPWARLAAGNISRPGSATLSVTLSVGIGLTVLIALLVVEGNFRHEVGGTLPAVAPSLFFVDIQPDQREAFTNLINNTAGVHDLNLRPMVRGRIASLNGIPAEQVKVKGGAKWALESDRGLSYAAEAPPGNPLVTGKWWGRNYDGPPLVSLDRKLADGMGLKLGDKIGLSIAGQPLDVTIANLRDVDYLTLQINFSLILSPGTIEQFPATFLGTARVDNGQQAELAVIRLITSHFPNISSIDIRDQLATFQKLVDQVAFAVRIIALITLFSGLMVLASSLISTLDRRAYDITMFKVLGASRQDIMRSFLAEWLALAVFTATISTILGSAGAWLILRSMDWVHYQWLPVTLIKTCVIAVGVMLITGTFIHNQIFSRRGLDFLRNE